MILEELEGNGNGRPCLQTQEIVDRRMNGGRHRSKLTGDEDDTETMESEDEENTLRRIQEVSRGYNTWNGYA